MEAPQLPDDASAHLHSCSEGKDTQESTNSQEEQSVENLEAEVENSTAQVATNSNRSRILENVERGTLEEGDRTI